jgi:predicted nucleotidyltransferase
MKYMSEQQLAEIAAAIQPITKKYGVQKLAVFGSFARGEDTDTSDIDFLVHLEPGRTLLDLAGLQISLTKKLQKDVDVVTYNSLHPLLKDEILQEQILLYEEN